jgi:CheY-like chemotaxis protein
VGEAVTVLIVEDDQLIQAMVEAALTDGGFESAITDSGEDAIALLDADKPQYRAVVTDINLFGNRNDWGVAQRAREIDPVMPVIYMTGDHGEDWASKGVPNSVLVDQAVCTSAACDDPFQSSQCGKPARRADKVRPPQLAGSSQPVLSVFDPSVLS